MAETNRVPLLGRQSKQNTSRNAVSVVAGHHHHDHLLRGLAMPTVAGVFLVLTSRIIFTEAASTCLRENALEPSFIGQPTPGLTVEMCIANCAGYGYFFAGIEGGEWCFCSHSVSGLSPSNQCNVRCADGSICGGINGIMSVWAADGPLFSRPRLFVKFTDDPTLSKMVIENNTYVDVTLTCDSTCEIHFGNGGFQRRRSGTHYLSQYYDDLPGTFDIIAKEPISGVTSDILQVVVPGMFNFEIKTCPSKVGPWKHEPCKFTFMDAVDPNATLVAIQEETGQEISFPLPEHVLKDS
ncbi:uncharacterized protein LOC143030166 [Oratosquilla oratoria]|uniref:uncharacterized protein LOC143030166 n=1 Tax=Oratosquilla oratoria TaxID=337810 RepID=UPI003F777DFB